MNTDKVELALSSSDFGELSRAVSIGAPSDFGELSRAVATLSLLPVPQINVKVRDATIADLPFIDELQKTHRKQLGFLKWPALEAKIAAKEILIAQEVGGQKSEVSGQKSAVSDGADLSSDIRPLISGTPLGYCIGTDRYFKHDDVGIIYQMNVVPGRQRSFIGATLLQALFDRAAYGCKLFCCWCAQDLAANRFWEAMGFVPLAFRSGGQKAKGKGQKGGRIHIFWQKRIRRGDATTPWWFPCETTGGAMGAARLALPIPPGVHWSDELPTLLPSQEKSEVRMLNDETKAKTIRNLKSEIAKPSPAKVLAVTKSNGLRFAIPEPKEEKKPTPKPVKKVSGPERSRRKNAPMLVSAARELRDRWLEALSAGEVTLLPEGKYDVAKMLPRDNPAERILTGVPYRALLEAA